MIEQNYIFLIFIYYRRLQNYLICVDVGKNLSRNTDTIRANLFMYLIFVNHQTPVITVTVQTCISIKNV